MKNFIRKLSLENQLLLCFILISVFLLITSLGISMGYNVNATRKNIDRNIENVSSYIASIGPVTSMLQDGYPNEQARQLLNAVYEDFGNIDSIAVYNSDGLRFYHTSRSHAGEIYADPQVVLQLMQENSYLATIVGTMGRQRTAYHEILDSEGNRIGFVMAAVFLSSISEQNNTLISAYIIIGLIMLVVSIALAQAVVLMLSSTLMGHDPHELLALYLQQGDVLNAMSEGLIATDNSGRILFANSAAHRIFSDIDLSYNQNIKKVFPDSRASEVIASRKENEARPIYFHSRHLIVNEYPFGEGRRQLGALTIFTDRTELETLSDSLSGSQNMVDTLRAFNHEYMNKLHIILGYLQIGQVEQAMRFIMNSSIVTSQALRHAAGCLRVSRICALVIGKMMHASESGILLTLAPDSSCHSADLLLPEEDLSTIIGNLLENAIEELNGAAAESDGDYPLREINLGIYCREDCNIIECEDTGRGIPAELKDHILEKGVSGKGTNRGTGLFLVSNIVAEYQGILTIDTEAGEGSCFTIIFTKEGEK